MKVSKDAAAAARRLFNLCLTEQGLDEDKLRKVIKAIAERKPRNYRGILFSFKRLIRLELAKKHVTIESAEELVTSTKQEVEVKLAAQHGTGLTFEYKINPALLGGIRIRKGDDVWDGSIKARLDRLASAF